MKKMKTKTRILSALLTLAMVLSTLVIVPFTASAANAEIWDKGDVTALPLDPDDNSGNTYLISSIEELAFFRDAVSGGNTYKTKTIKLTKSLDLAGKDWSSIGTNTKPFEGVFDGQGNAITGVTYSQASYNTAFSFFGKLNNPAVVKNLTLDIMWDMAESAVSVNGSWAGGLASTVYSGAKVENCNVTLNTRAGGLTLNSANLTIGGIAGYIQGGSKVTNTTVSGNVYIKTSVDKRVHTIGGFAGRGNAATYENCISHLSITIDTPKKVTAEPVWRIGGIIANAQVDANQDIKMTNCVWDGTIITKNYVNSPRIGGLIGAAEGSYSGADLTLTNCFSLGEIFSNQEGEPGANGGIIGWFSRTGAVYTLTNCYAAAALPFGVVSSAGNVNGKAPTVLFEDIKNLGVAINDDGEKAVVSVNLAGWSALATSEMEATVTYGDEALAVPTTTDDIAAYFVFDSAENATAALKLADGDFVYTVAADAKAEWKSFAEYGFAQGKGTADDPYYIENEKQLAFLAIAVAADKVSSIKSRDAFFILDAEDGIFDMSAYEWTTVQERHSRRAITFDFDGNNNTIKGVNLTKNDYRYAQTMFGCGSTNLYFRNVNIDGVKIDVTKAPASTELPSAAVLFGTLYGGTVENVAITNLEFTANIPGYSHSYLAGIAGYSAGASVVINGCYVEGAVDLISNCDSIRFGGLVGRARMTQIKNCETDLAITLDHNYTYYALPEGAEEGAEKVPTMHGHVRIGGMIGQAESNVITEIVDIENSIVSGFIDATVKGNPETVSLGGFIGFCCYTYGTAPDGTVNMTDCYDYATRTLNGEIDEATAVGLGAFIGINENSSALTIEYSISSTGTAIGIDKMTDTTTLTEVYAYDISNAVNTAGASLRIDKDNLDNSGIQFNFTVNKDLYNQLLADGWTVQLAIAMGPEETDEPAAILYDVAALAEAGYGVNGFIAETESDYYFGAALTAIKENHYTEEFAAFGAICISRLTDPADPDSELMMIGITDDATFACIADMAADALADTAPEGDGYVNFVEDGVYSRYSSAQRAILATYAGTTPAPIA